MILMTFLPAVIGGCHNQCTALRKITRNTEKELTNDVIATKPTHNLIPAYEAFMFRMEFFDTGEIQFTQDFVSEPFYTMNETISIDYLGFMNYLKTTGIIYFYDCPIDPPPNDTLRESTHVQRNATNGDTEKSGHSVTHINIHIH